MTSSNTLNPASSPDSGMATAGSSARPGSARVVAVDAGRGLAMSLLIATPLLLRVLRAFPDGAIVRKLQEHFSHAVWHGVTFYDIGLPGFVLIMGMSIALAFRKVVECRRVTPRLYIGLFRRTLILFVLGFLANGGFQKQWPDIRIAGPLQRIAICYFVGSLVFLHLRLRGQMVLLAALLLGYWALLALVPVPGFGAGNYSFEGNLAAYVDQKWLPGRPQFGPGQWDAEGIVTTLGAIATCVLGVVLGYVFRNDRLNSQGRVWFLFLVGVGLIALAYLWSEWLPLNKTLWTPSFVLFCAGHSTTHIAIMYQIADVWKKNWLFPLVVVGQNSLIAYLAIGILPFKDLATRLVGGDIQQLLGAAGPIVLGFVPLGLCWLLLYWLYRKDLTMKF